MVVQFFFPLFCYSSLLCALCVWYDSVFSDLSVVLSCVLCLTFSAGQSASQSWEFRALNLFYALTQLLFASCYSCTLSPGAVFILFALFATESRVKQEVMKWNPVRVQAWILISQPFFFTTAAPYFMSPSSINIIFVFLFYLVLQILLTSLFWSPWKVCILRSS